MFPAMLWKPEQEGSQPCQRGSRALYGQRKKNRPRI